MIFKPISAFPNNSSVIDAICDNVFSTIIQGSSSIVSGYQISISNSQTFEQVYTSGKVNLPKPLVAGETLSMNISKNTGMLLNGESYYWVIRLFEPSPTMLVTKSTVQDGSSTTTIKIRQHFNIKNEMYLKIGNEQRKIATYDSQTGIATVTEAFSAIPAKLVSVSIYSDFIDSLQFAFYAKSTPIVLFENIPETISMRCHDFKIKYMQEQGVPIRFYRVLLTDADNKIIDDTSAIYNSSLSYSFDGFIINNTYYIQAFVENMDGITVSTERCPLSVSYPSPNIDVPPILEIIEDCNAVKISWVADRQSIGVATGSYSLVENFPFQEEKSLSLESGEVYFDTVSGSPLLLSHDSTTIFSDISITEDSKDSLVTLSGDRDYFSVDIYGHSFFQNSNGNLTKIREIMPLECGQQINPTPKEDVGYIWVDTEVWNDSDYWVETLPFSKRYKLTISSDSAKLKEVIT